MRMKSLTTVFLFICLFFSFDLMAEGFRQAHVSLVGSAVKEFKPDITKWTISLRSEAKSADDAARQHAQTLSELLRYLKAKGVSEEDIKTQQMSLSENWNYSNGKRFKQGYVASAQLSFDSSIDSYTKFWTELSVFEGLSINGTHFELKDRIAANKEVRKQALLAAKEKAQSMAEVLDASLGKVLMIEDLNWDDDVELPVQSMAFVRSKEAMAMDAPIVSPGTLEIRSRVKVIFALK